MSAPVIIGDATLYLGDCAEVLPLLGPLDRCVTDVPYEFVASGGGKFRAARKCLDKIEAAALDKGFDHTVLKAEQFKAIALFCHNDQLPELLPYFAGLYHRAVVCAWHKSNPMPVCNEHYVPDTEPWLHVWQQGHAPQGRVKDLARYWIGPNGKQAEYDHPTVKPMTLMRKIVRNVGGTSVCDPFMGTGTTGVAALIEGRSFVGIENNPAYFAMAVRRINAAYRDGLIRSPAWTEPVQVRGGGASGVGEAG